MHPASFRRLRVCMAASAFALSPLVALGDTGPCGTNAGGTLPDLIVNPVKLAQYLSVGEEKFAPSSCSLQEGFVSSPGWHTLLRFTASTPNVGAGALVIGNPQNCPALFEQSSCHGHLHFKKYSDFRLWTPAGYDTWLATRDLSQPVSVGVNAAVLTQSLKNKSLLVGRKMGYCMMDSDIYGPNANPNPTYVACNTSQGISPGWADTYGAYLDGQYVEVDGLKSGDYVLEVHVNPDLLLAETTPLNNSSAIRLRFTARQGQLPASVQVMPPELTAGR